MPPTSRDTRKLCGQTFKRPPKLAFRIWGASDYKEEVATQALKAGMQPKRLSHNTLVTISFVGFADFSGNGKRNAGMRCAQARGLVKTKQRVNKAPGALFTQIFKINFLGKFKRFRKAERGRAHLKKLLSSRGDGELLAALSATATDYLFSASRRHTSKESVITETLEFLWLPSSFLHTHY